MSRAVTFLALLGPMLATLAPPGHAQPPVADIAATFGNTVISTYPDGRSQKIWFQPGGAWTGLSRKGVPLAGHWTLKDGKVCLRQSKPPTLPISFCQALPPDMIKGVDSRDVLGTPIHLHLVKGISENPG